MVWRAAERLGIEESAAHTVESEGLLTLSPRVLFRHPLVRSAVYGAAGPNERREVHRALAEATDAETDPDRRVWHRARAASVPDEDMTTELERSAARAQARGGFAAAAAFQRARGRTYAETRRRAERALAAAQAHLQAGAFAAALQLLAGAEPGLLNDWDVLTLSCCVGQIDFASSAGSGAPALLLKAAPGDRAAGYHARARDISGCLGRCILRRRLRPGGGHCRRSPVPPAQPPTHRSSAPGRPAAGRALGSGRPERAAAAPMLRRALSVLAEVEIPIAEGLRWGWLATHVAWALWDDQSWHGAVGRHLQTSPREAGLLDNPAGLSPNSRSQCGVAWRFCRTAVSLIAEADTIAEATGNGLARYAAVVLECFRGREAEARALIEVEMTKASAAGQGSGIQVCRWVSAVLHVGLGRCRRLSREARQAGEEAPELWTSGSALSEVIEAATRTGKTKSPAKRWSGWPRRRASARTIGVWASSLVHGRCSAMARPPRARIARRSSD